MHIRRVRTLVVCAAAGFALLGQFSPAAGQFVQPQLSPDASEVWNIFLPAPRNLRQNLTRAQAALDEQRYSDAVAELGEVLNRPESDDFFLGTPGKSDAQVSLKTQALQMLGAMPAKGRQMYELQFGSDAKALLEDALTTGDVQKLTDVSRRYFHTKAGYEATLLLGRIQLDQGRPLAAALMLKRIADVPSAAGQYDPELSVLLATCWVHARMPEKATETLLSLKQRLPKAKVRLLDREEPLFESTSGALAWLEDIVGGGRTQLSLAATEWVMFRGNEARNAVTAGGIPLLNFRWNLPTVNDPQDEQKVKSLARSVRDSGANLISSLQPLVVQDCVVIRAPDSNKLIGVDLKTGKRIWVFPPFDESPAIQATRTGTSPRTQTANLREHELKQRVWEDHAFGQVSSDGRQVYVIDDLGYAAMNNVSQPRIVIGAGGRPILNNAWSRPHNLLVALDLKRQGYQVWAVGGTTGDIPALAGAFFLGAPLPMGDQLYALVEINSEIRLVCLSAKDGSVEWKQQLAVVEDAQQIVNDRNRRLAGASPSYADGVLVCPTSAGACVAIDLSTRSLRWGYQYSRWDVSRRTANAFGGTTRSTVNANQGHWIDSTATIADGCVILTPVESQELHCLDLLTGKARWPAQPRDDMLYLACVHEGKAILVGKDKMKAISLADGKEAWQEPLKLDEETPTGRGYYSDGHYFLPTTGQQLLKIDLDQGKIAATVKTEIDLGNVVCYKDQLISQGPSFVASFYLTEPLAERIELALKKNPDDPEALTLKGQILLQEGKQQESLTMLRRAVEKNPESETARSLLVKVMLALLREDFAANFKLAEELDQLVTDPAQRLEVLRFRAQGLATAGKTWEAFQALVALAEQFAASGDIASAADALEYAERDLSVRRDRWLQGRFSALYLSGDEKARSQMTAAIEGHLAKAKKLDTSVSLRGFIDLYGFHPLADSARLALADKLTVADQLLEAELLVGSLLTSADAPTVASAKASLAAIYEKSKRPELAARYYLDLAANHADVICRDGLTGKQSADKAAESELLKPLLGNAWWPSGRTEIVTSDGEGGNRTIPYQRVQYPIQLTQFTGAATGGLRASFDPNQYQVVVRDELGRPLATGSLKNSDGSYRRYSIPYNLLMGKAGGHLVVVNLGGEVVAIDALRPERVNADSLVWRLEAIDLDPSTQRSLYPQQRQSVNPLVGNRFVTYDPTGRLNFNTGPVQSIGLCFQKGRQLLCVDPISGQSLWERTGMPPSAEIFGDQELIFIADPTTDEALVLSAIDGSELGRRKIEKSDRRWSTCGRRVLAWEQTGSLIKVRLYDAWTGKDLWSKQVPLGSRGCLVESDELAILEPGGEFSVISMETGELQFSSPLSPERSLSWIQVQRSREQYILIASHEPTEALPNVMVQPITTSNGQQNRVHGHVYAFDRRTGKSQWQVPAFVTQHCLPTDQPSESPLLIFVRNMSRTAGGAVAKTTASVLVIDKRDGRIVLEDDSAGPQSNHTDILADPVKKTVSLTLWSAPSPKTITFRLTDQPSPPQPPAQTGAQASLSVGEPLGTVEDVSDVFRALGGLQDVRNREPNPGGVGPIPRLRIAPQRALPPGQR